MRRVCICILASIILTGCSFLEDPEHMQAPALLGWIYRDCINQSSAEKIRDSFTAKVRNKTIVVDGFESIGVLEDAVIKRLADKPLPIHQTSNTTMWMEEVSHPAYYYKEYMDKYGNVSGGWGRDAVIIESDKDNAQKLFIALCDSYFAEYQRIGQDEIAVLNWIFDRDAQGDKYTGYLIEYEIGEGYYVLLSLIEYDESNRYKAEILYKGHSLQELRSLYE